MQTPMALEQGQGKSQLYKELGYEEWAKEKEYGLRWPSSEGIFSSVKRIFGEFVRSHKKRNMYRETILKFWSYQQIKDVE